MDYLSPKERLLRVLAKKQVDRPPVICPGGMMNAAVVEVMNKTGHTLPEAHRDSKLMRQLAYDIYQETGFENFGVPFCMTVEAEVLGSIIDYGTLACEPKITKEFSPSVSQVIFKDIKSMLQDGRIETIIQAGYYLAKQHSDVPLIGNLTGPISAGASIVDPMTFLKELRKDKENCHKVLDYVVELGIAYARLMLDNGVDLISIADPTATGEILGPKMFEEYAVKYLNKLIDGIHSFGAPAILHICGDLKRVKHLIPQIRSDAISTDAMVNLLYLREEFPELVTMGNVSTYLLEFSTPDKVADRAGKLARDGVDIIAPACGLSTSTPLVNIQRMTGAVKES